MKIKKLEFNDVFEAAEILKNIKVKLSKEELEMVERDGLAAGMQVVINMISNLKESKSDLNGFLGHLFGITGDEFGHLGLKDTAECIREIAKLKKSGEMIDFLDAVGQLIE